MSFAEKSVAVFGRDLFLRAWTLVTSIVIARILGPVDLGIWYILLMIPGYAEAFGRLKLDIASVYFLGKGKYKLGEVYFNLIIISLLSSAVIIILFFWQKNFISINLLKNSLSSNFLVYLMFAYIPLNFIITNYSYLFLAGDDVKGYNNLSLIYPVISAALGIFLLLTFKREILSLVAATLIGAITSIFYGALRISKTDKIIYHLNIDMLKDFFKFSWKLYISGFISYFQIYISGVLVAVFLLPQDVTFYQMGQQKALMLSMIASAMGTFLYPLVAKGSDSYGNEVAAKACRVNFLILTFLAIIGAILIKPAVYYLYGKDFMPQIFPFWILLPGSIFYGAMTILYPYFVGKARPEITLQLSFVPLIFQVCLCAILIPVFGMLGAAFAASLSYFAAGVISIIIFAKLSQINFIDIIIPQKNDIVLLLNFVKSQVLKLYKTAVNI